MELKLFAILSLTAVVNSRFIFEEPDIPKDNKELDQSINDIDFLAAPQLMDQIKPENILKYLTRPVKEKDELEKYVGDSSTEKHLLDVHIDYPQVDGLTSWDYPWWYTLGSSLSSIYDSVESDEVELDINSKEAPPGVTLLLALVPV